MKSEEAFEKLKVISNNIENERNRSCNIKFHNLSTKKLNVISDNFDKMNCNNPVDQDISSEISFNSGYRSSEHSEENYEDEDDTIEDILDNTIDTAVSSAAEKSNEKRSILKSVKPVGSKLFLSIQNGTGSASPAPGCEELPDLECVKNVKPVRDNISDSFPYHENKQPELFAPASMRKISFLNSDGKVVASSGLGSDEVVRSSLDIKSDHDNVFSRIRKISDNLGPKTRIRDQDHSSLVFVDQMGRVLATSNVKSPPGVRRRVKTVESRLLSGALPTPAREEAETELALAAPPSSAPAWVRLKEISKHLEISGPSLV